MVSFGRPARGESPARPPGGLPLDLDLSPYTGWTREHVTALADRLLLGVRPYASPGHGRITPPGAPGGYGRAVDGLEGFARTFLLAGFRLAGAGGADPLGLAGWYAEGLAEGTDTASPHRWVRPAECPQAKVEAACVALALDLARPLIWDRLDAGVQARVVDYLAEVVGDETFPRNNWVWFRVCVETFLRSVGGCWRAEDVAADLALAESFERSDGWAADGDERTYDHYAGWVLRCYPTLWQRMAGAHDLVDDAWRAASAQRLDRYLADAVHLVGADGGPLIQGRSLIYRFAAAAPLWAGALAGVPSVTPGLLRRAACGIVAHFHDRGVPDRDGRLSLGWFEEYRPLAQSYSGPGSPSWAAHGLLGLAAPPDHPVWTAVEEPLPVERGDFVRVITAPGWVVSGTRADGVVRLANHGTDHARPAGAADAAPAALAMGDSPLYAALGYSTATCPPVDDDAYRAPRAMAAGLAGPDGGLTHRAGFTTLGLGLDEAAGLTWAASRGSVFWLDCPDEQAHHGAGFLGRPTRAGALTVLSLVRGPWELRCVRVDEVTSGPRVLRVLGWPVAENQRELRTALTPLSGCLDARVTTVPSGGPLGAPVRVPLLDFPACCGEWALALVGLAGADTPANRPYVRLDQTGDGLRVAIGWPDGHLTDTLVRCLPAPGAVTTDRPDDGPSVSKEINE